MPKKNGKAEANPPYKKKAEIRKKENYKSTKTASANAAASE